MSNTIKIQTYTLDPPSLGPKHIEMFWRLHKEYDNSQCGFFLGGVQYLKDIKVINKRDKVYIDEFRVQ